MRTMLLLSLIFFVSCATPIAKNITIKVPAFEVLIVPKLDKFGYWWEDHRLLIIEGEDKFGKIYISHEVLSHEIRHMLYHLNSDLIYPDKKR